jgi:hypothetical protein
MARSRRNTILLAALVALAAGSTMARANALRPGSGPQHAPMPANCKQNLDKCSQEVWARDVFPHRGVQRSITFSNRMTLTCTSNGRDTPRSCTLN